MFSDGRYNAIVSGRWESSLLSPYYRSRRSTTAEEGGRRLIAWLKALS
jgi:hypothetical protein